MGQRVFDGFVEGLPVPPRPVTKVVVSFGTQRDFGFRRGLEAVAHAWREMAAVPKEARWEKPQGKNPPLVMNKQFEIVGRGVALVIGMEGAGRDGRRAIFRDDPELIGFVGLKGIEVAGEED